MEIQQKEELRKAYNKACDDYLKVWCEKHDLPIDYAEWVADEPGGVALVGDYYVDMQTILIDINMNAPEHEWWDWYDYSAEISMVGLPDKCNFKSWLMGCPRYSDESIARIAELKKKVYDAQENLEKAIKEEENRFDEFT